jgi:hypothetical protein
VQHYAELDRRHNASGHPGTVNLDKFLLLLKTRVFSRRTARSGWVETWVNAYDTCWHELEGGNRSAFASLVAQSQKQATAGPDSAPSENLWGTLGAHEAMGVWGMLKGMGLVLAGVADGAIWVAWKTQGLPLVMVLEHFGVKDAAKSPALTPYLTKSYDEVAQMMSEQFGKDPNDPSKPLVDPKRDESLFGQSSYEIGEFGGKIIGMLTMAGAGQAANWTSAGAQQAMPIMMKALGVMGAAKGIGDAGEAIATRVEEMQKKTPPPTLGDILADSRVQIELLNIVGNSLAAAGGVGDKAAPTFAKALAKAGIAVDVAGLAPVLAKLAVDLTDPELAKDPEARDAAVRDGIATIIGTILSTAGTKHQEGVEKQEQQRAQDREARNKAFNEKYNAHMQGPEVVPGGRRAPLPESTLVPGAEGMSEFDLGPAGDSGLELDTDRQGPFERIPGAEGPDSTLVAGAEAMNEFLPHSLDAEATATLQKIAFGKMTASGGDSLIKVVATGGKGQARVDSGGTAAGYVVQEKFVAGRTPEQIAQILGVTELAGGVTVYRLDLSKMQADMLQLRSYTNRPDGRSQYGPGQDPVGYPVGLGAPQWKLLKGVPATPLGSAAPGEKFVPAR